MERLPEAGCRNQASDEDTAPPTELPACARDSEAVRVAAVELREPRRALDDAHRVADHADADLEAAVHDNQMQIDRSSAFGQRTMPVTLPAATVNSPPASPARPPPSGTVNALIARCWAGDFCYTPWPVRPLTLETVETLSSGSESSDSDDTASDPPADELEENADHPWVQGDISRTSDSENSRSPFEYVPSEEGSND
jgi:hypothetical protein